jgi:hypothetical protein
MHEIVQAVFDKHKDKHKEVLEYLQSQGETQIGYSTEQIKILIESGKIPKELGDWFLKYNEENENQYIQMQAFIKNNPDIPIQERHKHFFKESILSPEDSAKILEDSTMSGQFFVYLLKNRHLLNEINTPKATSNGLFDDINIIEEFGIANCISNSLYHLTELLKNMKLTNLYGEVFEAKSSVKNSKGEVISLAYTFPANTDR